MHTRDSAAGDNHRADDVRGKKVSNSSLCEYGKGMRTVQETHTLRTYVGDVILKQCTWALCFS